MANADFLSELADYLAREGIGSSTTDPVNIFVGSYPDSPDNCVALLGLLGQTQPNVNIADFEYPRFQIVVRNIDYETGAGKLREIRQAIHDKLMITTEHFVALYIQAEQDGYPIGQDDKGRFEFSINFNAQYRYEDSGS